MVRPFDKYDGIKIEGHENLFSVLDIIPDYHHRSYIIVAEDVHSQARISVREELCEFVHLGQLDLFNK